MASWGLWFMVYGLWFMVDGFGSRVSTYLGRVRGRKGKMYCTLSLSLSPSLRVHLRAERLGHHVEGLAVVVEPEGVRARELRRLVWEFSG